jgi:hypothetical protein
VLSEPPVFPGRIDPGERFRDRRRRARRRRRIRRLATVAVLCGGIVALALNARFISGSGKPEAHARTAAAAATQKAAGAPAEPQQRPLPAELRGVHVTMALASVPGKLDEYLAMESDGMTAIELDVKDENGDVAFVSADAPLARTIGAARRYYDPRKVAAAVHAAGLYLIGRVVVFEDPRLSAARPGMAVKTPGGSVWRNDAGLGWTNPYDERVWDYNLAVAEAAARAGFDEIMFDYVRFPTDGSARAVYSPRAAEPKYRTIARFVEAATKRLKPLGVRVSAAVFGLSATRDLGIGQRPGLLAKYLDTIYPMVYPSHYGSGEYNIADPSAEPGRTVSFSLLDFRKKLEGRSARVVPWLQDFSLGRAYTLADVQQQISAARRARTAGFMLWNAEGVYTSAALAAR